MDIAAIYPRVAKVIADVLAVDESDVALNKRLIGDLGAESIDFLDCTFQLEREFGIKVPVRQIEKEVRSSLTEGEFEENGVLTSQGMQALKSYLSEVPNDFFKSNLKVNEIPTLFTVETFCKLVLNAITKQKTEAPVTA